MNSKKSMKNRMIGSVIFGMLGLIAGAGTGIVGGVFGAIAGVGLFTVIGAIYGWSAGPDIASLISRLRRK